LAQRETPTWCDNIEGVVDAFYSFDVFVGDAQRGNPAGVVIATKPWSESAMENLAGELGFSETAFVSGTPGAFHLRWFTPTTEVDLCGHATAATAAALVAEGMVAPGSDIDVVTRSGTLRCGASGNQAWVLLPERLLTKTPKPRWAPQALAAWSAPGWTLLECADRSALAAFAPEDLIAHGVQGLVVAFVVEESNCCALRVFGPSLGIDEDPVTGSAHSYLAPLLRSRMQGARYQALQCSGRGGIVEVILMANAVKITGALSLREHGSKEQGDY
jgi:predicted PhzF superfamily epimerase YddE/YHI9